MYQKFKIFSITLLLTCVSLKAQDRWSLDDCISYALQHNLQLENTNYDLASDKETYRQSIRNVLPTINGYSDYNIRYGRSIDPNDNSIVNTDFFSNNYSINSSIDLFQGFQKVNEIKAAKFMYKATREETLQQKYLLAFRIMRAYYDIQFFEGLLAISNEQQAVSQQNFDLVKKQIDLGLKAGADLYEAESLLFTDKLNVTQSANNLAAAKLKLLQEMNLTEVTDIVIDTPTTIKNEGNLMGELRTDSVYKDARNFVPIIKAQRLREQAAKKQIAVARGSLYPSVALFGGIGTGYYETTKNATGITIPFRDQFRDNTFQFVGVAVNIPISNGWSARSRVKQQKIAHLRAKNNLNLQEQELKQTIQGLVQEYRALETEYKQSNQKVKSQNLAFAIAQKRYEKGLISALELFTAKNLFASSQNENLQVRLRAEVNKRTLDFYKGLPIFNINE
ncbi:MAG: TolC family protein [Maribacter sp.]|nr:TolC family protein [Maribacter sp.]